MDQNNKNGMDNNMPEDDIESLWDSAKGKGWQGIMDALKKEKDNAMMGMNEKLIKPLMDKVNKLKDEDFPKTLDEFKKKLGM